MLVQLSRTYCKLRIPWNILLAFTKKICIHKYSPYNIQYEINWFPQVTFTTGVYKFDSIIWQKIQLFNRYCMIIRFNNIQSKADMQKIIMRKYGTVKESQSCIEGVVTKALNDRFQSYGRRSKYKLFQKKKKHNNDNEIYNLLMLIYGKSLTKPVYMRLYVHHHCPFLCKEYSHSTVVLISFPRAPSVFAMAF